MTKAEHAAHWKNPSYVLLVERLAAALKADGCSGVLDFYLLGCLEHDIAYRTHCDPFGNPTTKRVADTKMRWYIQHRSPLNGASPMSWWRWLAVKWFAAKAWNHEPEPFPVI